MPTSFEPLNFVATPVFVIVRMVDGGWAIRFLNKAHMDSSGMSFDPQRDLPIRSLFPEGVADGLIANYDAGAAAVDGPFSYEETLVLSGVERRFRTTLQQIALDDPGISYALMGTALDITVQADLQKQQALKRMESERMMALAAHDLRGPLRRLGQVHDLLVEGFQDHGDGKVELLEMMNDIVVRSQDYLSKIILYVEGEEVSASKQIIDLDRLTRDILHVYDPEGRASMQLNAPRLVADPVVIEILVRNFIENSFKYAEVQNLAFDFHVSDGSPGFVVLTLSDNGVGYGGRAVLGQRATEAAIGSGYGLPTISRIVTARGGAVQVTQSAFGQGAALEVVVRGQLSHELRRRA